VRREAELRAEAEELERHLEEARQHILRLSSLLLALGAYCAAYDAICGFHSYLTSYAYGPDRSAQLTGSFLIRGVGLVVPSMALLWYVSAYRPWTRNRTMAAAVLFATIPGAAVAGIIINTPVEVQPCDAIIDSVVPRCDAIYANTSVFACVVAGVDDADRDYCEHAPLAYITTLLLLHAFLPYTFTYAIDLPALMTLAAVSSGVGLLAVGWTETQRDGEHHILGLDAARWVRMLLYIGWAHALGVAHHFARRLDVVEASALRLRQQGQLREIYEETERCDKLLANIVPPHLIEQLKVRLLDTPSIHNGSGGDGKDEAAELRRRAKSRSRWREALQKLRKAKTLSSGATQRDKLQISGEGVLVAESYTNCSILFAKLEGLELLVNDEERAPVSVVTLLQKVFDKFDALADIYGVQKVRKTAYEQCIFAAGLPDGSLLPTPKARACGLAAFGFALVGVMEKLNIELRMWGVPLKLQVGIHSGAVIAGVIGHKTVQWDLCGDAVNTAARMCSYSSPGHVHVSEATYQLTKSSYMAINRGERTIKGKGTMRTYFLLNMPADGVQSFVPAQLTQHDSDVKNARDESTTSAAPPLVVTQAPKPLEPEPKVTSTSFLSFWGSPHTMEA